MAVVYCDKQQSDALIVLSPVEKTVCICKIHEVFLSASLADTALMNARADVSQAVLQHLSLLQIHQ